jgi:hypothetical protein
MTPAAPNRATLDMAILLKVKVQNERWRKIAAEIDDARESIVPR